MGVPGPSPTIEVAETSSARVVLTAEEVMELATCRYIDFPGVRVIDLQAPQLPEKVYKVAAERMFNETTIMETIASVSKALQEYERTGGFAPAAGAETTDAALMAPAAGDELVGDAPVPPPAGESREEPLPGPAEAVEAGAASAATEAVGAIVEEVRSSPPCPIAADTDRARVPDEPVAADQWQAAPEDSIRTASPEIQRSRGRGRPRPREPHGTRPRLLNWTVPQGRLLSGLGTTPRATRRWRCATPWSAG
jgi:hypothetical protein